MTALRDQIASLLEENHRKPSRVLANMVVQLIDSRPLPQIAPKTPAVQPEPARWVKYAETNEQWLRDGIATTRNRTDAAMQALGLDPKEIRAVVIEPHVVHVFRWTDASERIGIGLPIVTSVTRHQHHRVEKGPSKVKESGRNEH